MELAKALAARNHEDLAVELALAHQRLTELDIFKTADINVDLAPSGKAGDLVVDLNVCTCCVSALLDYMLELLSLVSQVCAELPLLLSLQIDEKGTYTLSTGTYVQVCDRRTIATARLFHFAALLVYDNPSLSGDQHACSKWRENM